ncbi:SECIS-binding protein 2 [Rhodnius prolixus]
MLNFKKVLLGDHNLDGEQSRWPELGSVEQVNLSNRAENDIPSPGDVKDSSVNINDSLYHNFVIPSQVGFSNNFTCNFPKLTDSFKKQGSKNKACNLRSPCGDESSDSTSSQVKKEKISPSKMKKPKTPSKANLTVDINVMLKISLNLAASRHQRKRLKYACKRSLKEHVKNVACGNKLDSDCPVKHKGKKRPHRRRKVTSIKRGFQWAAEKLKRNRPARSYYMKRMRRLRQVILAGMAAEQDIDGLVSNVGRMKINETQDGQFETQPTLLTSLDIAKSIIHTKKFRPYCNHLLKSSLKTKAEEFISTLRTYQDRMYYRDPVNSKARRRYVCGCHEARKFLRIQAVKMLFMANNLAVDNGIPPILEEILQKAEESQLPVIYAGSAFDLGYWTLKKNKTSVIAILNYDGAEKLYGEILCELSEAMKQYQLLLNQIQNHLVSNHHSTLDKVTLLQQMEQEIRKNLIAQLS